MHFPGGDAVYLAGRCSDCCAADIFAWIQGEHFPGLIPLIFTYLDIIECDEETRSVVSSYLELIVRRARGPLPAGVFY